jgi:hypothetical protein
MVIGASPLRDNSTPTLSRCHERKRAKTRPSQAISGSHIEQSVDQLDLPPQIRTAHPLGLAFPNHIHRFISLNRSARCLEFAESLLGIHAVDRSVVLFQDVCSGTARVGAGNGDEVPLPSLGLGWLRRRSASDPY